MIQVALEMLIIHKWLRIAKNQSYHIEMKSKLDHSANRFNSNDTNDTQNQIHMIKIFTVKVLVKLGQVAATNDATIWKNTNT